MQSLTTLSTYDVAIREQLIAYPDIAILIDKDVGDIDKIISKGVEQYSTDPQTMTRVVHVQLARLNLWATMYSLVKSGLLSESIWRQEFRPWIIAEFKGAIMQQTWNATKYSFSKQFYDEIEHIIREVTHALPI